MITRTLEMKRTMERKAMVMAACVLLSTAVIAGNPDRAGSAGATQLLINPWARSAGWGLANTASVTGVEAMYGNIAGLAHTHKTEILFSNTRWLSGSGTKINSIGLAQKMGASGVLGISATVIGFGDLEVTTVDDPAPGRGTFSPSMANIGVSYAKSFSNSIHGGLLIRVVSESIANVKASGVCFDAGIQYVTGEKENVHFGISLKNVGPAMKFSGDGLSVQGLLISGSDQLTLEQRSAQFEIPSLLNIGAAYDWHISETHRLSIAATFVSNSFTNDQGVFGLEYGFRKIVHLRGGYTFEKDITSSEDRSTVNTGLSAGISLALPFGEEKKGAVGIDYAYRATQPFDGSHSIGIRISL